MAALLTRSPRRVGQARFRFLVSLVAGAALLAGACSPGPNAAADGARDEVRIAGGAPGTLDPAASGDAGSSAVIAQLFETLTAIDPSLTVRPALADRWDLDDGGRTITFHLRDGLTFSDGTPLHPDDVVRSWLRIIDPDRPSPLAELMLDVEGARDYVAGRASPDDVGVRAEGDNVVVRLTRPAGDFASVVASPTFAVLPPGDADALDFYDADGFVASGGYVLADDSGPDLRLVRNERYWAGPPPIRSVVLVGDIGGRSPVSAFEDGDLDYVGIGDFDAGWIRFDPQLGPRLREVPSLSTEYLGFDTTRPPFDDVRVRQAFAQAVDWNRLVRLAGSGNVVPATSLVPPGTPGRSERNFLPPHDPAAARGLLAEAGYPGGRGFPTVTYLSGGATGDAGFVATIKRELGIDVRYESMAFDDYFTRLSAAPPQIWSLAWIADYPGANDFLGVLLATGSTNNYGGWSNPDFDAAVADAGQATDPAAARAAYDRAEAIVQREVPVVPLTSGTGWALARDGLLGATENGLGSLRFAGLAWDD